MTDTITVLATDSTVITTITANAILLWFDTNNYPYYYHNGAYVIVGLLDAALDSPSIVIDTSNDSLDTSYARVTTNASEEDVTSLFYVQSNPVTRKAQLVIEAPDSGQSLTWQFGASAPPIKLKVKITRN